MPSNISTNPPLPLFIVDSSPLQPSTAITLPTGSVPYGFCTVTSSSRKNNFWSFFDRTDRSHRNSHGRSIHLGLLEPYSSNSSSHTPRAPSVVNLKCQQISMTCLTSSSHKCSKKSFDSMWSRTLGRRMLSTWKCIPHRIQIYECSGYLKVL